jgi:four helix bundle protein
LRAHGVQLREARSLPESGVVRRPYLPGDGSLFAKNRAALSIAANIAEGNGRFTKPDRKNFFGIARGSVQECVPLLELARRRNLVSDAQHDALKAELEEIARMLSGLIKGLENRAV